MTNIKELKTQIEDANALGRQNLTDKGVEVEETATTYDIMSKIAEVSIEPLDYTVTFTVDGEPYEIVSVKNGNSVNKPCSTPIKKEENLVCSMWKNSNGNMIDFPYPPIEDTNLFGVWEYAFDGSFLLKGDVLPVIESVNGLEPSINKIESTNKGIFDNALLLGIDQWLKYESDIFRVGTNDFTLECWAKPNSSGEYQPLFTWYDGSNGDGFMSLTQTQVQWNFGGAGGSGDVIKSDININDGQFHHIAWVRHNGVCCIYVDGVQKVTSDNSKDLINNRLYIGINGAFDGYRSEYFDGLVDEIAFFNYAKYTTDFTPRTAPYVLVRDE